MSSGNGFRNSLICTYVSVLHLRVQYLCGTIFITGSGLSDTVEYWKIIAPPRCLNERKQYQKKKMYLLLLLLSSH